MKSLIFAAASCCLLLSACGGSPSPASGDDADRLLKLPEGGPVVEVINGVPVPLTLLQAVARGRGLDLADPAEKQRALDELQQYILLSQQAEQLELDKQPDLLAMIEASRLQGTANAVLLAYARANPASDADIEQEYQNQISRVGDKTYRITQLLFTDEASAGKAARELAAGKPFDKVFVDWRDKARDAQSYPGMFARQMPPELATAVTRLEPGQATQAPVKTSLGWHLVRLDDTKNYTPPELDMVRGQIREMLQQRQADAYLDTLKAAATVTLVAPAIATSVATDHVPPGIPHARTPTPVNQADPGLETSAE